MLLTVFKDADGEARARSSQESRMHFSFGDGKLMLMLLLLLLFLGHAGCVKTIVLEPENTTYAGKLQSNNHLSFRTSIEMLAAYVNQAMLIIYWFLWVRATYNAVLLVVFTLVITGFLKLDSVKRLINYLKGGGGAAAAAAAGSLNASAQGLQEGLLQELQGLQDALQELQAALRELGVAQELQEAAQRVIEAAKELRGVGGGGGFSTALARKLQASALELQEAARGLLAVLERQEAAAKELEEVAELQQKPKIHRRHGAPRVDAVSGSDGDDACGGSCVDGDGAGADASKD